MLAGEALGPAHGIAHSRNGSHSLQHFLGLEYILAPEVSGWLER